MFVSDYCMNRSRNSFEHSKICSSQSGNFDDYSHNHAIELHFIEKSNSTFLIIFSIEPELWGYKFAHNLPKYFDVSFVMRVNYKSCLIYNHIYTEVKQLIANMFVSNLAGLHFYHR